MKKLIAVLATIIVAAATQAASVKWTCTNVYKDSENKNSGVAYLVLESDVADFNSLAGDKAAINTALGKAKYSFTPTTAGTYSLTKTNAELGLSDGVAYGNAYLVIFDTATVTDSSNFYVTPSKGLTTYGGDNTTSVAFGSQATNSKLSDNWKGVSGGSQPDVPEPTSALLLLMGGAMLALRRKQK